MQNLISQFYFSDALADLNHAAARHRIAIRPNNRRGPSRLAANGVPCSSDGTPSPMDSPTTDEKSKKSLTRYINFDCNCQLSFDFGQTKLTTVTVWS